jgi:hypothetical protein
MFGALPVMRLAQPASRAMAMTAVHARILMRAPSVEGMESRIVPAGRRLV